jgi:antitoxin VapB
MMLIAPISHLAEIDLSEANKALVAWGHKMGPCNRPNGDMWAHGLFAHGRLAAVAIGSALISANVAGISRQDAFELARLCAARPDLCRVMLRLWREFAFPDLCRAKGWTWAISYQDEALHSGDTYRFDGWLMLKEHARSGTDQRSGRKGRSKTIWGWHSDPEIRRAMRAASNG